MGQGYRGTGQHAVEVRGRCKASVHGPAFTLRIPWLQALATCLQLNAVEISRLRAARGVQLSRRQSSAASSAVAAATSAVAASASTASTPAPAATANSSFASAAADPTTAFAAPAAPAAPTVSVAPADSRRISILEIATCWFPSPAQLVATTAAAAAPATAASAVAAVAGRVNPASLPTLRPPRLGEEEDAGAYLDPPMNNGASLALLQRHSSDSPPHTAEVGDGSGGAGVSDQGAVGLAIKLAMAVKARGAAEEVARQAEVARHGAEGAAEALREEVSPPRPPPHPAPPRPPPTLPRP